MVRGDEIADAVVAEAAALRDRGMSIAVIIRESGVSDLVANISAAGIACDRVGGAGLPGQEAVAVLDPLAAKGLEFDAVVVVEPSDIAELPSGLRHLYVSMTRPVQYLGLVASRPLPTLLGLSD
jgi:superfamily I DNA/RNA helicase